MSILKAIRGAGIKTRLLHPIDEFWDRRLGVCTVGFIPDVGLPGTPDWRCAYVPAKYRRVLASLRHVGLHPGDVFVDLGCGLGRPVYVASWLGAKRAVGVEIDRGLSTLASQAVPRSRLRTRDIQFVCAPAEQYAHQDTTVLFMFNPFGSGTMQAVVDNLERELRTRPRDLRIVYENPLQAAVLDACPLLERFDEWPSGVRGSPHPVAFWRSAGSARPTTGSPM